MPVFIHVLQEGTNQIGAVMELEQPLNENGYGLTYCSLQSVWQDGIICSKPDCQQNWRLAT